jgi:transposase
VNTNLIKKASKRPSRRSFSRQFKLQIVMQSLEPGASLSALALANALNSNQVFKWRREYLQLQGKVPVVPAVKMSTLLPVVMTRENATLSAPAPPPATAHAGYMNITLRHGQIRIEGAVDSDALRTLVQCMCV